jgi:hypothetical protein
MQLIACDKVLLCKTSLHNWMIFYVYVSIRKVDISMKFGVVALDQTF